MRIYRTMLGYDKPMSDRASDNASIEKLEILSPLSVVADLRIRLLFRIVLTAPAQLLLVLAAAFVFSRSWVKGVVLDLNRLARTSNKLKDYTDATCAEWVQLIKASPSAFLKLIALVLAQPCVNQVNFWGLDIKKNPSAQDAALEWYTCANCAYTCPTIQGLNWHLYHTHSL